MTDYISRDSVLDLLQRAITMSTCLSVEECKAKILQQEIDIDLVKSIPAADVRPKWISVEDELPKEWCPVLGLISFFNGDDKGQQVLWYCGYGLWRSVWNADKIESEVTHWMPLPQPPENSIEKIETSCENSIEKV